MDPRKTFVCTTCGFRMSDISRIHGKDTECPQCVYIKFMNKEAPKNEN